MSKDSKVWQGRTVGLDVGDRRSCLCVLDADGEILEESNVPTTPKAIEARFAGRERLRVVMETGTHANWLHDALEAMGHEVIVANARRVRAISDGDHKDDRTDAETLARLGRSDVRLLSPVDPRSSESRKDLELLRARAKLVEMRTALVNHMRGAVKPFGVRMPECSPESLHKHALPVELSNELAVMMQVLQSTTEAIAAYDDKIDALNETKYPQTKMLRQVHGVGPIMSLCYVLTIGDPRRFKDTRDVGAYLGITPKKRQSGASDPKLRITKSGDSMLRTLLVQSAHHILRRSSPDCDLKRFGLRLAQRGGKSPKQRAVVATARKLSVVLLAMWKTGEVYQPLRAPPKPATKKG